MLFNQKQDDYDLLKFWSFDGFRYFVRVFGGNAPGSELMVCACADLSTALNFARSFDKAYYDIDVFDADNSMARVDF